MFCFRDQNYCPLLIVAFHNMVHSYNLLTSSTVSFFKIFYLATLCSPHYSLVFFTLKQYTSINSGGVLWYVLSKRFGSEMQYYRVLRNIRKNSFYDKARLCCFILYSYYSLQKSINNFILGPSTMWEWRSPFCTLSQSM